MSEDLVSIGERIAEHAAHLDAAMHRLLSDLRRFDRRGGWYKQGARSCAHWLSWRVGWDLGTAREHVRVANKLAEVPQIDRALQSGELSYSKARAMTRVATPENEATLLGIARLSTAQQLETICRRYATVKRHGTDARPTDDAVRRYVTRRDTADGMVRIEAVLHPEEAALVWAALDHAAKQACRESDRVPAETTGTPADSSVDHRPAQASACVAREPEPGAVEHQAARRSVACQGAGGRVTGLGEPVTVEPVDPLAAEAPRERHGYASPLQGRFGRADALVAIAQGYARGDKPDRSPIELVITVEAATLATDPEGTEPTAVACFEDTTCVSAETARRLCCDAGIVELTQDPRGAPLSVGRRTRTIPGPMKRALLKRDRTCRFPGCTNRVFLEGHHIQHWADGGETKIENMVCICSHHHRFVHEYGYVIDLGADGLRFRDPCGRPVLDVPPTPRPEHLGWDAILASNERFGITAQTNECGWDGGPCDHGDVIDQLLRADRLA